ncbi:MAG: PAS domain-containing protein [Bacteriovoracaceae bacterium]|nr:PAS domain-containing protein [Bacteriovoracaceae bacterium]
MLNLLKYVGDHFVDCLVIVDMNTRERNCIYVNNRFEKNTGYSKDEAVGRNLAFLQGELTSKETVQFMKESFANNMACVQDIVNYKKDKTPFLNRLLMIPFQHEKKFFYMGFQNDVTDERGLEHNNASLRQVQDKEIRHMINNPLAIIMGKIALEKELRPESYNLEKVAQELTGTFLRINKFARETESLSDFEKFVA